MKKELEAAARAAAGMGSEVPILEVIRALCQRTAERYGGPVISSRGFRVALVEGERWTPASIARSGEVIQSRLLERFAALIDERGDDVSDEPVVILGREGEWVLTTAWWALKNPSVRYGFLSRLEQPTATSEWLPEGCRIPARKNEWEVRCDWEAAFQARADEELARRLEEMPASWREEREELIQLFLEDPSARLGRRRNGEWVRDLLLEDIERHEREMAALRAYEEARRANSPFAVLAKLKGSGG